MAYLNSNKRLNDGRLQASSIVGLVGIWLLRDGEQRNAPENGETLKKTRNSCRLINKDPSYFDEFDAAS
ncbi:hypothetical protein AC249_AIPGENE15645 [Exaiptasia diaphana]|nr:hypothetical protein AC249_AIPGENE15645 [Exaiptasia diaphana]